MSFGIQANGQEFKAALLKDIYEVSGAESFASGYCEGNGYVVFNATDGFSGDELWITKGTRESTKLLKDINPGTGGSAPSGFYKTGDVIYFSCYHPDYGKELWRTDGTAAGTYLVKDIYPGISNGYINSSFQNSSSVNGKTYFIGFDATGQGLWVTDGTALGTSRLIAESVFNKKIWQLYQFKENIYFTAQDNFDNAAGLYQYNVTDKVTKVIKDSGVQILGTMLSNSNFLFFEGQSFSSFQYVYVTDGSPNNSAVVFDSNHGRLQIANSETIFFTSQSGLWKTNGTLNGTVMIKDGFGEFSTSSFAKKKNEIVFIASTPSFGMELWKSDGSNSGTVLVKDIFPGSTGNAYGPVASIDSLVFFGADDGSNSGQYVVWMSDGTESRTIEVKTYLTTGDKERYRNPNDLKATSLGIFFSPAKYYTNSYGHEPYIIGLPKYIDNDVDGYGSEPVFVINALGNFSGKGADCETQIRTSFRGRQESQMAKTMIVTG